MLTLTPTWTLTLTLTLTPTWNLTNLRLDPPFHNSCRSPEALLFFCSTELQPQHSGAREHHRGECEAHTHTHMFIYLLPRLHSAIHTHQENICVPHVCVSV